MHELNKHNNIWMLQLINIILGSLTFVVWIMSIEYASTWKSVFYIVMFYILT